MSHANNEKRQTTLDGRNGNTKSRRLERSEKRKSTNIWASWKLTPSNKWR